MVEHIGKIFSGQCSLCMIETEEQCRIICPQWFTVKSKEIKMGLWGHVNQYVGENTQVKECVRIKSEDEEEVLICKEHLRALAEEVARKENQ